MQHRPIKRPAGDLDPRLHQLERNKMKKQLIMAAVGIALASGLAVTNASAAPISAGIGASEASTSLAEKVHYKRHYHNHHRRWGHRQWRPRMFGYLKHRHHNRHHHNRRYSRY
jgi:hypothetical protein